MRVLVTCVPQTGHILPVLPLAEAFAAQGDEVLVASGADAAEPVAARGLGFRPVGPPFADWFAALAARTRGTPGDGLPPERVEGYFVPRLFGEIGTAIVVDDLLAVAREFRPDLLVFDPLSYAGPLVAAVLGIRPVQHTVGPLTDPVVTELVTDAVSPIWRQHGLNVPPAAGTSTGTTVTICPTALDPAAGRLPNAQPLRPVALPRSGPRRRTCPATCRSARSSTSPSAHSPTPTPGSSVSCSTRSPTSRSTCSPPSERTTTRPHSAQRRPTPTSPVHPPGRAAAALRRRRAPRRRRYGVRRPRPRPTVSRAAAKRRQLHHRRPAGDRAGRPRAHAGRGDTRGGAGSRTGRPWPARASAGRATVGRRHRRDALPGSGRGDSARLAIPSATYWKGHRDGHQRHHGRRTADPCGHHDAPGPADAGRRRRRG